MHEGKALRKLIKGDDRGVGEIAAKIGVSRGYMYVLYKMPLLDDYYKEKFKSIGILVDSEDLTKVDSRGEGVFKMNFKRQYPYTKDSGELSIMNEIITMSLMDLLRLQKEGSNGEMEKLITKLIEHKQRIESLEAENKALLREMIEILKKKG